MSYTLCDLVRLYQAGEITSAELPKTFGRRVGCADWLDAFGLLSAEEQATLKATLVNLARDGWIIGSVPFPYEDERKALKTHLIRIGWIEGS